MLQNAKYRSHVLQAAILAVALGFVLLIAQATVHNLRSRGIPLGFDFLTLPSRFVISESLLEYRNRDPYYWAVLVGIGNTLFISVLVAVFSTLLGLIVGIGRLSSNPLVAASCRIWVEVTRNTPPIVLLIFLYSLWWRVLPPVDGAYNPLPGIFLSMRGLTMPALSVSISPLASILLVTAAFSAVAALLPRLRHLRRTTLAFAVAAAAAGWLTGHFTVTADWPIFEHGNYWGGFELTPELSTVVVGLTLYTTGFVAEIVRAGILSVGKGQWEAGRALGLRPRQILRLVVVPQMLRVVVPPMTSQYINIVKNSTLAIAVGYPDFLSVMGTVINKSSHAIEGVAIILGAYLAINLSLSLLLNWYNRRVALVER